MAGFSEPVQQLSVLQLWQCHSWCGQLLPGTTTSLCDCTKDRQSASVSSNSLCRCVYGCFLQAVLEQRQEFGQRVVRQVPVEWIGVASEVKVMGDFDDWTRGHELSAEDVTSDSVYSR
jgi:hypothetical protein